MSEDLQHLEQRVATKFAAALSGRVPENAFDPSGWLDGINMSDWNMEALPPGTPQFPREQWVSYPTRRTVALVLADQMLDFDELSDEQWMQLCFIVQYGGKERVA